MILLKYRHYYGGLFLAGLALAFLYSSNQALNGDQLQTLFRGYMAAHQNNWLNYGNAASVVGNVPGSLSTLLVGVPLVIWDSPWAPMLVIIALNVVALFLFDRVIRQTFTNPERLLFLILFWLSPWFLYQHMLYNPAYLFFCASLHFYTAFNLREKAHFWPSFFHIIAIGLVMQLHYSWPLMVLISGYLFIRGIIKINFYAVTLAVVVILASLIPYLLEVIASESDATRPEEFAKQRYIGWGIVHVYPVIKAFIYWLRYGSFLFTEKLISGATFDWITYNESLRIVVQYSYRGLLYGVGLFTLFFSVKANWYLFKRVKSTALSGGIINRIFSKQPSPNLQVLGSEDWILLYLAACIVAIVISAGLSPTIFGYWHLIMLYPFAALNILIYLKHQHIKPTNLVRYFVAIAGFSIFVNLVAAHDSVKFTYKVPYKVQVENWLIENGM